MEDNAERTASPGSSRTSPGQDEHRRDRRHDAGETAQRHSGAGGHGDHGGDHGSDSDEKGTARAAEQTGQQAASGGGGPAKPQTHEQQAERKKRVLTQGTASVVRSIASAVVAKDGEPFFICPPEGSISTRSDHGFGLYYHDCRFLAGYDLELAGTHLDSLAATAASGTSATLELTNPEIHLPDGGKLAKETLTIRWAREVEGGQTRLRDRLTFKSFSDSALSFPVSASFAARFEDIFLIRGMLDDHRGTLHDPRWDGDSLVFSYDGRDKLRRTLSITVSPAPARRHDDGVEWDVKVDGRGETTLEVTLAIGEQVQPGGKPIEERAKQASGGTTRGGGTRLDRGAKEQDWIGGDGWTTSVRSDSYLLDAVLARSLDDLRMLRGSINGLTYYEAGIPWFATLFGRDSIIASLQSLAFDTSTAKGTLRLLASMQGTKEDEWRDEAPGKILHELRIGELARIGAIPHTPYYGTIDATPLFLILLRDYVAWSGDVDLFGELRPHVDRALEWLDRYADSNGDGFVDYQSEKGHGLVNQGWKDSGDGIVDSRARIATPPIALAEVQGYAYAARHGIADLLEGSGDAKAAADQRRKAEDLRGRFEKEYWSDDLGTYILALQHGDAPCDVVTSNAGQVLWSGIASDEHARRTAERLLREDMYDGWGIRTLSSKARAFNPIGYHLGTVWPHDNSIIAAGFRRYGLDEPAERLFTAILETAADFPHFRLPECFAGYGRKAFGMPIRYPVACHPQAWAAGSVPYLLTSTLGLAPDATGGRLHVIRPMLPDFVDSLELRGLKVGKGMADIRFRDTDHGVDVEVLRADGGLDVQVIDDSAQGQPQPYGRGGSHGGARGGGDGARGGDGDRGSQRSDGQGHDAAEKDTEAQGAGGGRAGSAPRAPARSGDGGSKRT